MIHHVKMECLLTEQMSCPLIVRNLTVTQRNHTVTLWRQMICWREKILSALTMTWCRPPSLLQPSCLLAFFRPCSYQDRIFISDGVMNSCKIRSVKQREKYGGIRKARSWCRLVFAVVLWVDLVEFQYYIQVCTDKSTFPFPAIQKIKRAEIAGGVPLKKIMRRLGNHTPLPKES